MRPLHILHVATQSTTAFKFVLPFALYMRDQGHRVTIACTDESFPDAASYMDELRQTGLSIRVLRMKRPISPLFDLRALLQAYSWIRTERFDLVHTHNAKAGVIGRVAAWLARVPSIVHTNHGLPFHITGRFSKFENILHLCIERTVCKMTDVVFVVSHEELEKAARFRVIPRQRMMFTSQGIDVEFFTKQPPHLRKEQRAKLGVENDSTRVVGVVARCVEHKGLDCFIRAASMIATQHRDVRFVLIGDGEERPTLERLAVQHGLEGIIRFVGFRKDPEEIRAWYSAMDVFMLPTRWESFGIVFLEAMAMGVPVVGPQIEPILSVVGDAGMLVKPDCEEAFAKAVSKLFMDRDVYADFQRRGRGRVVQHFSERALFRRLEGVYAELVDRTVSLSR